MTIGEMMKKIIGQSGGNRGDINHLLKVYSYAKTIGQLEGLDEVTQFTLEAAAVIHDIAVPVCREKYGSTNGKLQEQESEVLIREFFAGSDLPAEILERLVFLVSHHHTYAGVEGIDYQILLEADYLVNADEMNQSQEAIRHMRDTVFKTAAGTALLDEIYGM